MENLKRLASQQLILCANCSLLVASIMLSHDNKFGFAMLALSAICGTGAFLKSKNR